MQPSTVPETGSFADGAMKTRSGASAGPEAQRWLSALITVKELISLYNRLLSTLRPCSQTRISKGKNDGLESRSGRVKRSSTPAPV
jgi:hypothetical protein